MLDELKKSKKTRLNIGSSLLFYDWGVCFLIFLLFKRGLGIIFLLTGFTVTTCPTIRELCQKKTHLELTVCAVTMKS